MSSCFLFRFTVSMVCFLFHGSLVLASDHQTRDLFANPTIVPQRPVATLPFCSDFAPIEANEFYACKFLTSSALYADRNKKIFGDFFSERFYQEAKNFFLNESFQDLEQSAAEFLSLFGRATTEEHKLGILLGLKKRLGPEIKGPVFELKLPITVSARHFFFLDYSDRDKALLQGAMRSDMLSSGFTELLGNPAEISKQLERLKKIYWDVSVSDAEASVIWPIETKSDLFNAWIGLEVARPMSSRSEIYHQYLNPARQELKAYQVNGSNVYENFIKQLSESIRFGQDAPNAPIPFAMDAFFSYLQAFTATRLELSSQEELWRVGPTFRLAWKLGGPARPMADLFLRFNVCPKNRATIPVWTNGVWQPSEMPALFTSWPVIFQATLSGKVTLTPGLDLSASIDFFWRRAVEPSLLLDSYSPSLERDLQIGMIGELTRLAGQRALKGFAQVQISQFFGFDDVALKIGGHATINSKNSFSDIGLWSGLAIQF